MTELNIRFVDLTGKWDFVGQPVYPDGSTGQGIIAITFKQNGTEIVGDLVSVIEPATNQPPNDPALTNARVSGQVVISPKGSSNLLRFTRVNEMSDFTAVFIGIISESGKAIEGYFVNNQRVHGNFRMTKST